jgi:hypothetical protein
MRCCAELGSRDSLKGGIKSSDHLNNNHILKGYPHKIPHRNESTITNYPPINRSVLLKQSLLATISIAIVPPALLPPPTLAAFPSLPSSQPEPIPFPRRTLGQLFAVLLLRSGYEAVDSLDFIAMDDFQIKFWKQRQSEYEPYTLQYDPIKIKQGDLTDPNYFDFIAFAQSTTVSQEAAHGRQVFKEFDCEEEECPPETSYKLVTRNPLFKDNALLPGEWERQTGDKIYDGLVEGFRGQVFGGPKPCSSKSNSRGGNNIVGAPTNLLGGSSGNNSNSSKKCSTEELVDGIRQILDIFEKNGFALKCTMTQQSDDGSSFIIKVEGGANLWAIQALQARGSSVLPLYDMFVIESYLRRSGGGGVSGGKKKEKWMEVVQTSPTSVTYSLTL